MKRSELAPAMQRDGVTQKELAEELTKRTGVPVSAPKISRWLSGAVDAMRGIKTADVAAAFEAVLADRRARHEAWEQEVAAGALLPKRTAQDIDRLIAHRRRLPASQLSIMELEERIEIRERYISRLLHNRAWSSDSAENDAFLAKARAELAEAIRLLCGRDPENALTADEKCGACSRVFGGGVTEIHLAVAARSI